MLPEHNFLDYVAGDQIYGDCFSPNQISRWFADEAEAYAELGAKEESKYKYLYHELNKAHGFSWVPDKVFKNVLGLGAAYGDEFDPIITRVENLTVVESSEAFIASRNKRKIHYVKADAFGRLPLENDKFDLATSFGVLHHMPNITCIVEQIYKSLTPGGVFLIREPISTMGDWRRLRQGLTKHERGLPQKLFSRILQRCGFEIINFSFCMFPVSGMIGKILRIPTYNNEAFVMFDSLLSRLFGWNNYYWRPSFFKKCAPGCGFWVCAKKD